MKGMMVTIPVYGPIKQETLNAPPELESLQGAVGGYLEPVPQFHSFETENGSIVRCVALCNEEGKVVRPPLPFNPRAQALWDACLKRTFGFGPEPDWLAGTIVVLYGDRQFMEAL